MLGLDSAAWIQPFRVLAAMLLLPIVVIAAMKLWFVSPVWPTGKGALLAAALVCFAFIPRRILRRFWTAAALLACAQLGVTLFDLRDLASSGIDRMLLAGHAMIAAVFSVMLIEAVQLRHRGK